jgi:hypothetical protein
MNSGTRNILWVSALAIVALAGPAFAADKATEAAERKWDPLSGFVVLSDVAEVEPNNPISLAQALGCGNVLRPATISSSADTDYVSFTATAGTVLTIGTDADGTTGQLVDSRIRLFSDVGVVLASDDDSGPGTYSLLTFTATYTGTYYVGIAGFNSTYTGAYKAFVNCVAPQPPPPNDNCAGAIPLQCSNVNISGTTAFATHDYTPFASGLGGCTGFTAFGRDIVYYINAGAGDGLDLLYTNTADGSIYVITDCTNPTGTCVAGADATLTGQPEHLLYTFPSTGVYYLILDSFGTNTGGTFTLTGQVICNVVPTARRSWGQLKSIYR